jgi:formate hydrogenlyase transcriptional activator
MQQQPHDDARAEPAGPFQTLGLDDAAELFRLAAESLPSGVVVAGPDGAIVMVNRHIEQLFGYTRDELVGQPVEILLPDALGAGQTVCGRRRDGSEFPVEVGLNAIATEHGSFVLAAVVDISGRREVDDANARAVEAHLDFERMVAELSVQFINLPDAEVDSAILEALRRTGEALALDRCTFYRLHDNGEATNVVSWQAPGVPPIPASIPAKEQFPWAFNQVLSGETLCFSSVDEVPDAIDRRGFEALGTRSTVSVPLSVGGRVVATAAFHMVREERSWHADDVHRLRVMGSALGSVLARRDSEAALRGVLSEVERLRDRLQAENVHLRREVQERHGTGVIVGRTPAIQAVLDQIRQVAPTDSTVLLLGETGTGKELFATQIHELSARKSRAMVRVNCSAIPSTLIESELFGREKGAFTGALARQIGRFELADHSTIFLDEIGELPLEVQVKLLRALEERQIERLGSPRSIRIDTRIIAATHRDLERRIVEGAFREDLFYRLNVFPIRVPPLRERVDDIPLLVWRFVEEFSRGFAKPIDAISQESMAALQQYSWPGNIRELRNVVERAMIVARGPRLIIPSPLDATAPPKRNMKLTDVEREHIRTVLESTNWRVRGPGGAADRLGLRPTTLETRLAKLGLKRPKHS